MEVEVERRTLECPYPYIRLTENFVICRPQMFTLAPRVTPPSSSLRATTKSRRGYLVLPTPINMYLGSRVSSGYRLFETSTSTESHPDLTA